MTHKPATSIERDIRNQQLIEQMKRLTRKGKLMVFFNRHRIPLIFATAAVVWTAFWIWAIAAANAVECPTPGQKCKVLFLSPEEEKMLMAPNAILDTAAQGRAIELGQFSVYLKTRIGAAPEGDVKPVEPVAPKQSEGGKEKQAGPDKPLDNKPSATPN
jgi:hypothetical protein